MGILWTIIWGTGLEAAPLSVYTSFSVRSPKDQPNPFDYELAFGVAFDHTLTGLLDLQRERDNGKMYTNQEYKVRCSKRWWDLQVRYFDNEEDRLFIHSYSLAAKPVIWIGVGLTRQYARRSFGQGAWLGRLDIERTWDIGAVPLRTQFTYESNLQRRWIFGKLEVRGLHVGRLQVIPYGVYEGLKQKGKPTLDRYRAKVKLQIDFGERK